MAKVIKVEIDREKCIGCGIAPSLCPEVFHLIEDGKNAIVELYRVENNPAVGKIPYSDELEECVRQAAEACPVAAIKVEIIEE